MRKTCCEICAVDRIRSSLAGVLILLPRRTGAGGGGGGGAGGGAPARPPTMPPVTPPTTPAVPPLEPPRAGGGGAVGTGASAGLEATTRQLAAVAFAITADRSRDGLPLPDPSAFLSENSGAAYAALTAQLMFCGSVPVSLRNAAIMPFSIGHGESRFDL